MRRLVGRIRVWWSRRTIQFRTSLVATLVALFGLSVMAHVCVSFIGWLMMNSVDTELRGKATVAASRVTSGSPVGAGADVRVLDSAGQPVDGMPSTELRPWEINALKAGSGVVQAARYPVDQWTYRWVGMVVAEPSGEPRLVLAGTALVGYTDTVGIVGQILAFGSIAAACLVGGATWMVVRRSLRPVKRMREVAPTLPEGERLPVPHAKDELRALAEALNTMLARRDADTEWLRRFTGDAAHELRNPVTAIRTQAEVAVVHPDPEQATETLQEIATEAQRLSELVEGMLALARAEAGTQPEAQPVDLAATVRASIDRVNMRGALPRVRAVIPAGSLVITASPAEVSTVADNLIANAMRYTRALVRVSLLPAAGMARLVVDDDGPGIPEEHRSRVFDRFHRVEQHRAAKTGASGLGLSLVAEAVRRRGGSVRAGESPEGGARIEVRWPIARPSLAE